MVSRERVYSGALGDICFERGLFGVPVHTRVMPLCNGKIISPMALTT